MAPRPTVNRQTVERPVRTGRIRTAKTKKEQATKGGNFFFLTIPIEYNMLKLDSFSGPAGSCYQRSSS